MSDVWIAPFLVAAAGLLLGVGIGTWIGMSWHSLPRLNAGQVVRFRAEQVGVEYRLRIQSVTRDLDGTFVQLYTPHRSSDGGGTS